MFNRMTSTKLFAPRRPRRKFRNPKHEILNKPKHSNLKVKIRNEIVWNFMDFDHLDLFRISDFEFRTFNSIYTWRPLPRGIAFRANNPTLVKWVFHGARHLFPDWVFKNSIEYFESKIKNLKSKMGKG